MNKKIFNHHQSAIGTKVLINNNTNQIKKFIKHECTSNENLINIYEKYINDWKDYQYFLPTKVDIEKEYLVVIQEFYGEPFLIDNKVAEESLNLVLPPIIELCKYAQAKELYADPHVKNFTKKNNKLMYVDISPPYSKEYNTLVVKKTNNKLEKQIIKNNCEFFRWDWLPYHFVGDLLSINLESILLFDFIYEKMRCVLPNNIDKESFYQKAITVRYYEDKRSLLGLNLL